MIRNIAVWAGVVVGVVCLRSWVWATDIEWQDISRGNIKVRTVLVDAYNPKIIYMGTHNAVLKSEDSGLGWRNVLLVSGQNRVVNFLSFDPQRKNLIYAATGNGLYSSQDYGRHWSKIFKGRNYLEADCTTLAVLPSGIYLGTKQGLFLSQDYGRSWHKATDRLGDTQILAIAFSLKEAKCIYVACVEGVFKSSDSGKSWDRIFSVLASGDDNEYQDSPEENDSEEQTSRLNYLAVDPNHPGTIYLATQNGILRSYNAGLNWDVFLDSGLLNKEVKFIGISDKSEIFCATKTGAFKFTGDSWQELSFALAVKEVKFLALGQQGNIYLACDAGLFKGCEGKNRIIINSGDLMHYSKNEPAITEVQKVAIYYAEVEPEKIQRWRKQANMRAILPKLTISVDHDNDKTISKNIWGIYSSYSSNGSITAPGRYYSGPDDETEYNNNNFSVSLSWELGDLIWNNDQTSIDTRSRLMVQLRDDILDEVTRTYFERMRVKMELNSLSIEDRKKRFEKELRIQELTASLDALTGGYFSQHINPDSS